MGRDARGRDRALGRALDEYRVVGVQTTVPFFQWLIRQREFLERRFDTTYLDGVLAERHGQSFSTPAPRDLQDAAIAAALDAWFRAHRAGAEASTTSGAWQRAARLEGLR